MAMTAGSVTIADNGTPSGTGLAEALYNARMNVYAQFTPPIPVPLGAFGVDIKRAQALLATADASAIVTYLTANAKARIAIGQGGLQKTPNPNTADTATVGPIATQDIAIV